VPTSLDIQIRMATFPDLRWGRRPADALHEAPVLGPFFIDDADVAGVTAMVGQQPGVARLQVPINVFVVTEASVMASANAVPSGALTPAGQATIILQLAVQGTQLSLTCTGVDDSQFVAALGPAAASGLAQ
jgi:hypothetical protein